MGVNPNSYINIQGWMITDLGLKGNELLLYGLIYGFSQDGASCFTGSLKYMTDWLGCTKPTVINTLNSLKEKGLIKKNTYEMDGITRCRYLAVAPKESMQKSQDPPEKPSKKKHEFILSEESKKKISKFSPALAKALKDWEKYKAERKDKYTPTGADKLITQIDNAAKKYGDHAVVDVIDRSIASGYQGIVWDWLKRQASGANHGTGNVFMEMWQDEYGAQKGGGYGEP